MEKFEQCKYSLENKKLYRIKNFCVRAYMIDSII